MGELEEEIRKELNLRYILVSYNDINGHVPTPELHMIENDIWESMHPLENDFKGDSLYMIFKYWSMGSPGYPVTPEIIHEEIPYFSVNLIENAFEKWNLIPWESIHKENREYLPEFFDMSILDVDFFTGDYSMKLAKDNEVLGINIKLELVELANFRKKYFLDDEIKDNVEFVEGDFLYSSNEPFGSFDRILLNYPNPPNEISDEPIKFLLSCFKNLKPNGQVRLVTENDDLFQRFKQYYFDDLSVKTARERYSCPVDTQTSRKLLHEEPDRPFYEIVWGKEH